MHLCIYSADPGSDSEQSLRLMASTLAPVRDTSTRQKE